MSSSGGMEGADLDTFVTSAVVVRLSPNGLDHVDRRNLQSSMSIIARTLLSVSDSSKSFAAILLDLVGFAGGSSSSSSDNTTPFLIRADGAGATEAVPVEAGASLSGFASGGAPVSSSARTSDFLFVPRCCRH